MFPGVRDRFDPFPELQKGKFVDIRKFRYSEPVRIGVLGKSRCADLCHYVACESSLP